jgi:hypothetical protein
VGTVGNIIERVMERKIDRTLLERLYEIGMDAVSYLAAWPSWALSAESEHRVPNYDEVTNGSDDHEEVEDLMVAEHTRGRIRAAQCVDDCAHGVDRSTRDQ